MSSAYGHMTIAGPGHKQAKGITLLPEGPSGVSVECSCSLCTSSSVGVATHLPTGGHPFRWTHRACATSALTGWVEVRGAEVPSRGPCLQCTQKTSLEPNSEGLLDELVS